MQWPHVTAPFPRFWPLPAGRVGTALALCLALAPRPLAHAQERPVIPKDMNEQVVMIPVGSGLFGVELETTLFVPPGTGPHPLVIINHGKALGDPRFDPRARFPVAAREFLRRGYLVALPMRRGFSKSGGRYTDPGCNIEGEGRFQAEDVFGVLAELAKRPDVDRDRVLLAGQSHGGLTVMAAASKAPAGVRGVLNFAGGLRVRTLTCSWERALVDAFGGYGKDARVPSLWFYGDNDSYWGAELPKEMHRAYTAGGGKAMRIAYGLFAGGDAHGLFSNAKGVAIWWPETERFLRELGLPTEVKFAIGTTARPPKTDFAALTDAAAVPHLDARRRASYRKFLDLPMPRAFAIAPTGNIGWAYEGTDPLAAALAHCERLARQPCRLYAVDDEVVWKPQ